MTFLFSLVLAVLLVDQLTKILVVSTMSHGGSIPIIKNIFHLTYVENTGAAFGIFPNQMVFFIIVSVLAVILLTAYYFQIPSDDYWLKSSVSLIMGGALGNLIDRVRLGAVIDFLDFRIWPVFNIADTAISIGVGMLIFSIFYEKSTVNE